MKVEAIKERSKKRTMRTVTIRMPESVIADLKEIAPSLGYSGYQPLIKAYISQGLRRDLREREFSTKHLIRLLSVLGISIDEERLEEAKEQIGAQLYAKG